jgi:hypothetical protein
MPRKSSPPTSPGNRSRQPGQFRSAGPWPGRTLREAYASSGKAASPYARMQTHPSRRSARLPSRVGDGVFMHIAGHRELRNRAGRQGIPGSRARESPVQGGRTSPNPRRKQIRRTRNSMPPASVRTPSSRTTLGARENLNQSGGKTSLVANPVPRYYPRMQAGYFAC